MNVELGFWKSAASKRDAIAIVDPDGTEHRFGELLDHCNQLVHGLRALGLKRGDTLAMAMPNCHQALEVFMAAAQAGWRVTPVNWHLTAAEVGYILQDSESKVWITASRCGDIARAAAQEINFPSAMCYSIDGGIEGFKDYSSLLDGQPPSTPEDRSAGGPMTYTSGTTGHPKGVRRPVGDATPEQVATQQALFLSLFGMFPGSAGVHLVVAPLYHTAVLNFASNHLHLGHSVVLMDKWEPEETLRLIERYSVTNSHMVPTMLTRMLKLPQETRDKYNLKSLSHVIHSAAPCPVAIKQKMLDWWGDCIYEYYAASEGGGTLATPGDWRAKPGTVGKPWPISQIRILNDEQQPLKAGEVGTVWIRMGDHRFEYHKDKAKTEKSWLDGFFTVGDAGYLDEDGFLFLSDRKADMIISGGVNIYPAEIEAVFVTHPKVQDVAIFGVPNEDWGEEVMAVIQAADGAEPGAALEQELREYASSRVAKYKMPRKIEFISEMPRDPNGKLYKRKLRDPHWEGHDRAI